MYKMVSPGVVRKGEVNGKNQSKMTKTSVYHASYLRKDKSYDCHLWYTCVK